MVSLSSEQRELVRRTLEPQYVIGDLSRLHLGENPFPTDVKRVVNKN